MDPLETFAAIYGQVPDWVALMHEYAPAGLQHYTELRMSIMKDGALPRKDKELILIGINAARRYETSMIYHTQGALDAGATPLEIADTVLTAVITRGLPAWLEGQKAIKFALEHTQSGATPSDAVSANPTRVKPLSSLEECEQYYLDMFGTLPEWARRLRDTLPEALVAYTNLRNQTLRDVEIPAKLKELVLVGINVAERYEAGVGIHARGALQKGVTKAQLAECFLVAVLTAGIPAWFTGYEFLKD